MQHQPIQQLQAKLFQLKTLNLPKLPPHRGNYYNLNAYNRSNSAPLNQPAHSIPQPAKHFQSTSSVANISSITWEEQKELPPQLLQLQQALPFNSNWHPPCNHQLCTSLSEVSTSPSEEPKRLQHQPMQPQPASPVQFQLVHTTQQLVPYFSLTSSGSQPTSLKTTKDSNSFKPKGITSCQFLFPTKFCSIILY
eukprot:Phypoly_transcript_01403.p2 GENE.Phypoly_transcript_01403~~Phypoly_transcript_01403.p2  ORF type:complete len:194 (-),score=31.67 Phypoly_transcript_01403:1009-1590(-)